MSNIVDVIPRPVDLASVRRRRAVVDTVVAHLVPRGRLIHPSLLSCPHCSSPEVSILTRGGAQHAVRCESCGVVRALDDQGRRKPLPSAVPSLLRAVRL